MADAQASMCAELVAQWTALGVDAAFLAPGSRSTPMALALDRHPGMNVDVFLDERSAAFAALGFGLATGRPAIVLCTSGTAAAHLFAAVIEADLSGVPVLVVTADRPPELRDVGAAQTIDQVKMFGDAVRWFHDPGVAEWTVADSWPALAARSHAAAVGRRPGPVHLNLPFREPLVGDATVRDDARRPRRSSVGHPVLADSDVAELARSLSGRRGILVAGRGASSAVDSLAAALSWPILAEPRARCAASIRHFDSLVRNPSFADAHRPEVVVRIGEPPASKVLNQWLKSCGAEQIHVAADDKYFDPDHRLARRLVSDIDDLASRLAAQVRPASKPWLAEWTVAEDRASLAVDDLLGSSNEASGPGVARLLGGALPEGAHIVVSSSMPVRDLEWFGGDLGEVTVHSNRGANGIDGVMATAIGVARATARPVVAWLGDVAFVHDSSSLAGLRDRGLDVRILVTHNDGGGIFGYLPQASLVDGGSFERLFGTPHGTDVEGLARAHGLRAHTFAKLDGLGDFLSAAGPSVAVVRTDRAGDQVWHRRLHDAVAAATA